jgi:hypothetical protein
MRMMKIIFSLLMCVALVSCANPFIRPEGIKSIIPQTEHSDTLIIGIEQKKTVGESMITKTLLIYYPGFVADNDYAPPSVGGMRIPAVTRNSMWMCSDQYKDGAYLCKPTSAWGTFITPLGGPMSPEIFRLVIDPNGVPLGLGGAAGWINKFSEQQRKEFTISKVVQEGSLKQELIYNGKSKDTLKIAYREFKNDFTRPAFYQDLSYDMSESKEIGFRGMVIDILEATNSYVRFIVKKPMTN